MKRNWFYATFVIVIIAAITLAGCKPAPTPTAPPPVVTEPPPEVVTEEPPEEEEFPMVLMIKLRDDVTWSDGTPLTAHDFVFSYEMLMDPGNAVQTRYPFDTFVDSVVAVDDYTLKINLTDTYVAWPIGIGFLMPLPRHVLEPVFEAEGTIDNAEWNWNPDVSVGPFTLSEWRTASHLIFEANPDYYQGQPALDQVFIRIVPDDKAQMAAIQTGDSDIGVFISAADTPTIEAIEGVEMVGTSSGYIESWFFNLIDEDMAAERGLTPTHPALLDKRVRQAIAMSVDRQQIIDELFYGLYRISPSLWYDSPYEDPNLENWPYDPDAAMALLDEAGWVDSNGDGTRDKDGVELVLQYSTTAGNALREATQVVVQNMLAEVGIGVQIQNYSYDVIWNGYAEDGPIATGKYHIAQWSTCPWDFPDPNTGDWLCEEIPSEDNPSGGNWQGVCMEQLNDLFHQQAVTVDEDERIAMIHEIAAIMKDEVFWLGMRTDPDFFTLNARLQNVRLAGVHPFWNVVEWDTADDNKTATITFFEEPDVLNTYYTSMWFAGITRELWLDRLWVYDDEGELVPRLAAEIPSVDNGGIIVAGE